MEGGVIRALDLPDGRLTLALPPGTVADRVESIGTTVVDMRGTRLAPDGRQWFRLLRSEVDDVPGAVSGFEWIRGDEESQGAARDLLGAPLLRRYGQRAARRFAALTACANCHPPDKRPTYRDGQEGLPNRETDSSGFYQVLAVLSDEAPLETYRPRDLNVDDPFVHVRWDGGAEPRVRRLPRGAVHVTCADGSPPRGRLDLVAALRAGDARARAVCRARAKLAHHMDDAARRRFDSSLRACAAAGDDESPT